MKTFNRACEVYMQIIIDKTLTEFKWIDENESKIAYK